MAAIGKEEESDEIQILQISEYEKKRILTLSRKYATELDSQVKTCLWKLVNAVEDSVDQDPDDLLVLVHRIPLEWDEDMVEDVCSSEGPIEDLQLVPLAYYPFKSALLRFVDPEAARLTVCRSPLKLVDSGECILFEFAITPVKYDVLYKVTVGRTTIGKMEFIDYLETFGKIYRFGSYCHMARTDGVVSYCDRENYGVVLRAEHLGIADSQLTVRPLPASADWLDRVESNDVVMFGWTNYRSKEIRHELQKYDLKVEITVIPSSDAADDDDDEDVSTSAIISFSRQEFADKFLSDHKALRLEDGSTLLVKRVLTDAQMEPALKGETFTRRYMRWRDISIVGQEDYYAAKITPSLKKNRAVDATKDDAEDDITVVAVKRPKNLSTQNVASARETSNHAGILLSSSNAPTWTWDDSPGDTGKSGVEQTGRKKELSGAQKKKLKKQKWLESLGIMTEKPTVAQPDISKSVGAAKIVTEPSDGVQVVGGNNSTKKAKSTSGKSMAPGAKFANVLGKTGIPASIINNPYSMRAQMLKANAVSSPELIAAGVPEKFPQSFKARGSSRAGQPKYPPKKKPKFVPDPNRNNLGDYAEARSFGNITKITRTGRAAQHDGVRNDGVVFPQVEDVMMDLCGDDDDATSGVFNPANPVGRKGAGIHMDAYTGTNPFGRKYPSKKFDKKRMGHMDNNLYIGDSLTKPGSGMNAYAMPGSSGSVFDGGLNVSDVNQIPLSNPRQFGHGGAMGDNTVFSLNPGVVDPFPAMEGGHQGYGSFSQMPQWTPSYGSSVVFPAINVVESVNATPIGQTRQFGGSGSMVPSVANLSFPVPIATEGSWFGRMEALASYSQNPTPAMATNRSDSEMRSAASVQSGRTWTGFVDDKKSGSKSTVVDQAGFSSSHKADPLSRSKRDEANLLDGVNAIPISNPRKFSGGGNPEVVPGSGLNATADYGSYDGAWLRDYFGGSSVPSNNLSSPDSRSGGLSGAKYERGRSSYSDGLSALSSKRFDGDGRGTSSSKASLTYPAAEYSGDSSGAKLGDYLNAYLKGTKKNPGGSDSVNNIPVNPKRSFGFEADSVGSSFQDTYSSGVIYRSSNFAQPIVKKNNLGDWRSDAMGTTAAKNSGGYGMFDPKLLTEANASVGSVSRQQPPKTTKRPPPPARGSAASNNNVRLLLEAADVSHNTIEVLARENLLHPIVLCAIREEDMREMNVSIGDRKRINVVIKALSAGCP